MRGDARIQVGRVLGPHGVRGLVKFEAYLEDPETVDRLTDLQDEAGRHLRLTLEGRTGRAFIARIAGVDTREAAEALGGAAVFVPRSCLGEPDDDEFFAADLTGLTVENEEGTVMGTVIGVAEFGAGPLIEVKPLSGKSTLFLPFTQDVVPQVDVAAGRMRVKLQPGLWPDKD